MPGYSTTVSCADPSGGSTSEETNVATIDLQGGETVTCTFTNTTSIGGVTSFLTDGSGSYAGSIALLAGGVASGLAIAVAAGWYTLRHRPADRS